MWESVSGCNSLWHVLSFTISHPHCGLGRVRAGSDLQVSVYEILLCFQSKAGKGRSKWQRSCFIRNKMRESDPVTVLRANSEVHKRLSATGACPVVVLPPLVCWACPEDRKSFPEVLLYVRPRKRACLTELVKTCVKCLCMAQKCSCWVGERRWWVLAVRRDVLKLSLKKAIRASHKAWGVLSWKGKCCWLRSQRIFWYKYLVAAVLRATTVLCWERAR